MKEVMLSDIIDDEISRISKSDSEKKLIKFHLENSVKLNGSSKENIRDAVNTAKLKANEKKILSQMEEMKEALRAQATTDTAKDISSVSVKEPEKEKWSRKDQELLRRFGALK
jgi:hypothetical protein